LYKLIVVTDSENAHGFRLAGVDVVEANNTQEARDQIIALINDDDSGIIAVNEDFMAAIDDRTRDKIEKIYRPIVVPIPAKKKIEVAEERREYLARLIRRAVGFDIKLRQG
jgi:V/A-type H+-transporting ATPase subunit F